jgi:hypothetical protein
MRRNRAPEGRQDLKLGATTSTWRGRLFAARSEAGASLILALIFIVSISAIVGTLADWAMNDLGNTTKFDAASKLDYAMSGATEVAIQSIRYKPIYTETASTNAEPGYCWTPGNGATVSGLTLNGYSVDVWCSTLQQLTASTTGTRIVTFYTCLSTESVQSCVANPFLKAVVAYDDYPNSHTQAPLTQTCTTTCGEGASQQEWVWASQS